MIKYPSFIENTCTEFWRIIYCLLYTSENGELVLNFTPKLAKWLFDEGKATFRLLSTCDVTYVNNTGKDTYGADAAVVDKVEIDGKVVSTENKITGRCV